MDTKDLLTDDVQALQDGFRGELLRPGDSGYEGARRIWNGMRDAHPAVIAVCSGVADVKAAVKFARERDVPVAVRSSFTANEERLTAVKRLYDPDGVFGRISPVSVAD